LLFRQEASNALPDIQIVEAEIKLSAGWTFEKVRSGGGDGGQLHLIASIKTCVTCLILKALLGTKMTNKRPPSSVIEHIESKVSMSFGGNQSFTSSDSPNMAAP
jgi:hypothetical protein